MPERNGFGIVYDGEVFMDAWVQRGELRGVGTAYFPGDWRTFVDELSAFPAVDASLKMTHNRGGISVRVHPKDTSGHYHIDVELADVDGFNRVACRFKAEYSDIQKLLQQFAALFEAHHPELSFYELPTM